MKFQLISIAPTPADNDDAIVTVWCKPGCLESLIGIRTVCEAFVGHENQWRDLEGVSLPTAESRMLQRLWRAHYGNQKFQ